MTIYYEVKENKSFIGRDSEQSRLRSIAQQKQAAIIVIYGRRRVGKTELIEQTFRERNILKFEGIEGLDTTEQMQHLVKQFAHYLQDNLITKVKFDTWTDFLMAIHEKTKSGSVTLYFEELQWIANYDERFVAELKYVWDNFFRRNDNLILILCGSSASFMINKVLNSKALYNRSQSEICLEPFTLNETRNFFKNKSKQEILDAYLFVGGIPAYLNVLKGNSSILINLCREAFIKDGFFVKEYDRIFTSALSTNKYYKQIINYLANKKFATRNEIAKHLKTSAGGTLSNLLLDLEISGFIDRYSPYNLADNSKLVRFCIKDAYLQFYYKFIDPIKDKIRHGDYKDDPLLAINKGVLQKWQGFAFERFCRSNHRVIAHKLGFGSVSYKSGTYYNASTNKNDPGYQIDLMFDRDDKVVTICEIKYLQSKVGTDVIEQFERKLNLFPNKNNKTIHKVLITVSGVAATLVKRGYFDEYICLDDFLEY